MTPHEQYIVSRKNRFNLTMGAPSTPVEVATRMVDMGRQMGKSRILVESLPDDGRAIIMVWNQSAGDYLKGLIRDVRGYEYPVKELVFITHAQWKDKQRILPPGPVFVDNHVFDMLAIEITQWINSITNPENTECEPSTPTTTDSSEKSSRKSRTKSKKSATDND